MANKHLQSVDEQYEPPTRGGSGDGGGDSFGERLARLETRIEYLATKEDVSEVKVLIERKLNWLLYGIVGVMLTSIAALITALIRLW